MCTLIVLHRCVADRPLIVAANRDEFLARPSEGPAVRPDPVSGGRVLTPLDLEAGGTWLGLNDRGVFVGLTNLRPEGAEDLNAAVPLVEGARSRGEVVMAALGARSVEAATEHVARLDGDAYNPFQLLIADRSAASLTVYRGRPRTRTLEPGIHVIGNVEDDRTLAALGVANPDAARVSAQPRARKLTRIRERVEKWMTDPGPDVLSRLAEVCREHVDAERTGPPGGQVGAPSTDVSPVSPFESTCVHLADRYGTRSSFLLELARIPEASRLWTTDGPPCERAFEDKSALLEDLGLAAVSTGRA